MKLYVARHGETEWNSRDIISGVTDIELSEKGRSQARELAEKISAENTDIGVIICSPMKRAGHTAS